MSSSNSSTNPTSRALQEENRTLKVLVGQLQEELKQKDVLIATLESQIGALVIGNRRTMKTTAANPHTHHEGEQEDESETIGYDDGDNLSRISSLGLGSIAPRTEPQHRQWVMTQQQQQQQHQQHQQQLLSKPIPTGGRSIAATTTTPPVDAYNNNNNMKSLNQWNSDDESESPRKQQQQQRTAAVAFGAGTGGDGGGDGPGLPPPYPSMCRPPSCNNDDMEGRYGGTTTPKPSSSSKVGNGKSNNMSSSSNNKNQKNGTRIGNNDADGRYHPGMNGQYNNGTTIPSTTLTDNNFHDENHPDGHNNHYHPSSFKKETTTPGRKTMMQPGKGAIKALPRELAIYNNDDDDVTKYSVDDGQPSYDVQKIEFRDAYNARGIYTGSVQRAEQMPHGYGKMIYHVGGRYYEGDWHLGHWHGHGIIRNAEGDVYEGQVSNDLKQGTGQMTYADGRIFKGTFHENEAVDGTIIFPDGARYVGSLHKGARHGYGVYYFTDGSKYEGQSVMNVFEGPGKMTWNDGGWYEGEFAQGEIHGFGKEIRADGSLRHDGRWSKGVPIRI